MSINCMAVTIRCPQCGQKNVFYDYHENTSSERFEYFVVLNSKEGDPALHCPYCNTVYSADKVFCAPYCTVEDVDAYITILEEGLADYEERGFFCFSEWNAEEKPFPALDRLCAMYPGNMRLSMLRTAYKHILTGGRKALKNYCKAEVYRGTVTKYYVPIPAIFKKIYIHDGVTSVENQAFKGCIRLPDVYLPDSIIAVREEAFSGCKSLKQIHMSNGVTEIGRRAFYGCSELKEFYIPQKLRIIGEEAFMGCKSLKQLWLPEGIEIGKNAFCGCLDLVYISVPESVSDEQLRFGGLLPETHVIRYGKNEIPKKYDGELKKHEWIDLVVYPEGTLAIDNSTFNLFGYSSVRHVQIPESVIRIGVDAFRNCENLEEVTLPANLQKIQSGAFMFCTSIQTMIIPDNITEIPPYMFGFCLSLKTVSIPDHVTKIGGYAFEFCRCLTEIQLPSALTEIGENAFEYCRSLERVRIPGGVSKIRRETFSSCSSLKELTLEHGIQSVEGGAFSSCKSLMSVWIPASVTYLDKSAFTGCTSLTAIEVAPENSEYASVDGFVFRKNQTTLILCPPGISGNLDLSLPVLQIGWGAFSMCDKIESITLPDGLTVIGEFAFSNCDHLCELKIPASVKEIKAGAFNRNGALKKIFYTGSEQQWSEIILNPQYNEVLKQVEVIFCAR